nr:hypothetical protein [Tanacetum cinerariifolium]
PAHRRVYGRPHLARRRAGPGQNPHGEHAGPGAAPALSARAVHARLAALRPGGHHDLQPEPIGF